jgi:hypothetical protein
MLFLGVSIIQSVYILILIWQIYLRIILVLTTIMLIIQLLSILLRPALSLKAIPSILSLGLSQLVDLGTCEAGKEFLGEGVGDWLSYVVDIR